MADSSQKLPPPGVRLKVDIEAREGARGTTYWARVRRHDPPTSRRVGVKRSHPTMEEAEAWIERMRNAARTGFDEGQTLATYLANIGAGWNRGIDPTSTYDPYAAGLKRRVLPTLGHLPVAMITAGLVDRAIDAWELHYGRSTVKNWVAALVLVLDEAVRDGIIGRNPAKDRARRQTGRSPVDDGPTGPRDLAPPDVAALERLRVGDVDGRAPDDRLIAGPRGADAGVELHLLQRVAGHQDPAVTSRYWHPDPGCARRRHRLLDVVVRKWSGEATARCCRRRTRGA